MPAINYSAYYDLESLIETVIQPRFHEQGYLSVEDFFTIIIWKANRSKSRIATHLIEKHDSAGNRSQQLTKAVHDLTSGLVQRETPEEKFKYLIEDWGLRLPMASAILAMLYPDDFTVYDVRVCEELGDFRSLANSTDTDMLWQDYQEFVRAVEDKLPGRTLREADRHLWGRSFYMQLIEDAKAGFLPRRQNESK